MELSPGVWVGGMGDSEWVFTLADPLERVGESDVFLCDRRECGTTNKSAFNRVGDSLLQLFGGN